MTTPHGRLGRRDFIDAAARFIDEHGEAEFTLRTLGAALGVDQSAVYRHFRDRAALVDAVQEWLFERIVQRRPNPQGTAREQLVAGLTAIRQVLLEHPNLAVLTGRGDGLTVEIELANWALDLLQQVGLQGDTKLVAYQMLESYVYGTSIYDCTGGPEAMESRRRWYRAMGRADTDRVARSAASIHELSDQAFDTGLQAVLDACERLATA
jgi:TetR/AcrR family tetracycline transcriptional repressor